MKMLLTVFACGGMKEAKISDIHCAACASYTEVRHQTVVDLQTMQ